ncbi:H-NS family nucleoid-associated regulatory protein [Paeniroseomonas aquatica]|uniref:H-NS histone family protein n=1 Tax=Paeniroseomonas aquatica TaxID=373043 RepID=UPI00360AA2F9
MPELAALIEAAQAKRQEKLEGAKADLLSEFRDKAAELGLSISALVAAQKPAKERKTRRSKGEKVAPKYQDPATGGTWTGRGREPAWIKGKDRGEFLV